MLTIIDRAEEERYVERLRSDFGFFLLELWKDRNLNRFAPLDRVELDIAHWIQHGPSLRGVLGARQIGKSYFGTAGFTVFRLRQDRERKILLPSKTKAAMGEIVGLCREWLDRVWFLQDLAPVYPTKDRATEFNCEGCAEHRQPSVKALSNEGTPEGNRAHTILPDDIETKDNTKTFESRESLANVVNEYVNILYTDLDEAPEDDPDIIPCAIPSEVCIFGTVKCDDTLYVRLTKLGYAFRSWPLVYPSSAEIKGAIGMSPILLDDLEEGKAVEGDPVFRRRFGPEYCKKKQSSLPASEWLREYQLQVNLAETRPQRLRLEDVMVMHVDRDSAPVHLVYGPSPQTAISTIRTQSFGNDAFYAPAAIDNRRAPYSGTKGFVDVSGGGKDANGIAIVGHYGGFLYVKGVYAVPGGYSEGALDQLALHLRTHGASEVYLESNYGGGMFAVLFEPVLRRRWLEPGQDPLYPAGWKCVIVDDKKITHVATIRGGGPSDKGSRIIHDLELVTTQHRMVWDYTVAENQAFQFQYTHIKPEPIRHRWGGAKIRWEIGESPNELDALAGCVRAWTHALNMDPERVKRELDAEDQTEKNIESLRDFLRSHGLRKKPDVNWLRPLK